MTHPVLPISLQTALQNHGSVDWVNEVIADLIAQNRSFTQEPPRVKVPKVSVPDIPGLSAERQRRRLSAAAERQLGYANLSGEANDTFDANHLGRLTEFVKKTIPSLPEATAAELVTWVVTKAT